MCKPNNKIIAHNKDKHYFTYGNRINVNNSVVNCFNYLALRGVKGRSAGYENRGHSPAIEGVRHHIVDGTPALRPPSERPRIRRTTQSSPCCLTRLSKVWRPDASAKEHGSGGRESRFSSLSPQGG